MMMTVLDADTSSLSKTVGPEHVAGQTRLADRWAGPVQWIALGLIVVSVIATARLLPVAQAVQMLRSWVADAGIWGPLVYALVYGVATVLFVPGSAMTLAAGAVFGLWIGTLTVSAGSTLGAALAFLVARYLARERVAAKAARHPRFGAIDRAVGKEGWKIIALLRLSPVVPFNLSNYIYGLTAVRFGPYVLASWAGMLPGTFMYVYAGYAAARGLEAATGAAPGTGLTTWLQLLIGLAATVAVTVYVTRLAMRAIREQVVADGPAAPQSTEQAPAPPHRWSWRTTLLTLVALGSAGGAAYAHLHPDRLRGLFGPPRVTLREAYADESGSATFDHSAFDALLRKYVDADGWVDYAGLKRESARLRAYIDALAAAPFGKLGRDEKLALLINAYNAFTLQLILEHYPLKSIRDIPAARRWNDVRWKIGPLTVSLDQIEHEQIRPKFREPRIHFALVCAAVGCPKLRNEAYTAARLDAQLDDQMRYAHTHDRWFHYDPQQNVLYLTRLYKWYGGDFKQVAGSVLEFAARYAPDLRRALDAGRKPTIRWLEYDWKLNDVRNRPENPSEKP